VRLRDTPLRKKLLVLVAAAASLALLLGAGAMLVYEVRTFRPRVQRDLETLALVMRANVHASLNFDDPVAATETLSTLEARPEIEAACVYTREGTRFACFGRADASPAPESTTAIPAVAFGERDLAILGPVEHEGQTIGYLYMRRSLESLPLRLPEYGLMFATLTIALTFVTIVLTSVLGRAVADPILLLASTARNVTEREDYNLEVVAHGRDEVGELTRAMNAMLQAIRRRESELREVNRALEERGHELTRELAERRLVESSRESLESQLRQAQKMESIGHLAGGIAHDFNNLLTPILGYVHMSLSGIPAEAPLRRYLSRVQEAAERARDLTRQLLAFARKQVLSMQQIDLGREVARFRDIVRRMVREDIEIVVRVAEGVPLVKADPTQVNQVLMNLVVNAQDAMPTHGTLTLSVSEVVVTPDEARASPDLEAGRFVLLEVRDTGVGMDEATRAQIFEPFFTTKGPGRGTGLGLATVFGIVKQHKGGIAVETAPGKGTAMRIFLPVAEGASAGHPAPTPMPAPAQGGETVLVVEDEDLVRELARDVLQRAGYRVIDASRPSEAIARADEHGGVIDLLLTDVVMPEMNGRALHARLLERRPSLRALYMSGYSDNVLGDRGILEPGTDLLEKPFEVDALLRRVRSVLQRGRKEA